MIRTTRGIASSLDVLWPALIYLLDTNAAIAILDGHPVQVRVALQRTLAAGIAVMLPSVAEFELWYGVFRSRRQTENTVRVQDLLPTFSAIVPLDSEDARTAAEIRAYLASRGAPIGPYDVLIAAQALQRDATLVTANLGEFARVPGLKCVNWEEST